MFIARVISPLIATEKHSFFMGQKLLVCREELLDGTLAERTVLALDTLQSGPGDRVLVAKNGGAVDDVLQMKDCPANVVIVAHVQAVDKS